MTYRVDSLWQAVDAAAATGGKTVSNWNATGVSIDSRTLKSGDLFVALRGPNFDGHNFVVDAFERGASAALISYKPKGINKNIPILEVSDTFAGLNNLGIAGRARTEAKIIAVTGSVGKTSVKEAIANLLSKQARVSYSHGGLNNEFGVPLSLARLPKNAEFGVFELGMNRAGELTNLSRMVRPLVALVTTVELAHLEFFNSIEDIARAKAEIFGGLENDGVAILNRDNFSYDILANAANSIGADIVSFGFHQEATFKVDSFKLNPESSFVNAICGQQELSFKINIPGSHWIRNSLAVLAAINSIGANIFEAAQSFGSVTPIIGRGMHKHVRASRFRFKLIDDSYNASPASVSAALENLTRIGQKSSGRLLAVLGDMLELGHTSQDLHVNLAIEVVDQKIDLVYAVGPKMRHMFDALPASKRGHWSETSEEILGILVSHLKNNDVVLVKGSLGVNMGLIVNGLTELGVKG